MITVKELRRIAPHLAKTIAESGIDPVELIQEAVDKYGLSQKQAIAAVYRGMGATLAQVGEITRQYMDDEPRQGCPKSSSNRQQYVNNARKGFALVNQSKQSKAVMANVFRRYHQRHGQHLVVDRSSIVSDLEVLKVKATKDKQYGPAVRATELQGRAAGVNFTEHVLIESDRLSDAVILDQIAGDDAELARRLKVRLGAIEGEWQEITEDNQEVTE